MIPLLPLRAIALGLSLSQSGVFLASLYCTVVISTVFSPTILATAGSPRRALIASALIRTLVFPFLSSTQLSILVIGGWICWLCFGLEFCALKVHANSILSSESRGAKLGVIYLTAPLGAVVGGGVLGGLTNVWGFSSAIYIASAATPLAIFASSRLSLQKLGRAGTFQLRKPKLPAVVLPLAVLNLAANCVGLVARSATPLAMKSHGFGAGTPALASAVGGLFVLPLVPWLGALSDRRGRLFILTIGYVAASLGVLTLVFARDLTMFFLASVLASVFLYGTPGIRTAVIGDVASPDNLSRATAMYEAYGWAGAMLGFAATGFGIERFGWKFLVFVAALGGLAAIQLGIGMPRFVSKSSH